MRRWRSFDFYSLGAQSCDVFAPTSAGAIGGPHDSRWCADQYSKRPGYGALSCDVLGQLVAAFDAPTRPTPFPKFAHVRLHVLQEGGTGGILRFHTRKNIRRRPVHWVAVFLKRLWSWVWRRAKPAPRICAIQRRGG